MDITLSYSQASTWEQCKRRWGYRYWFQEPSTPTEALIAGGRIHKEIEEYLNNEVLLLDQGSDAYQAKQFIEEKCFDTMEVETHLEYLEGNTTLHGYADVILRFCTGETCIIDWKTTIKNKAPASMKPEHKEQLHLYGFMAGLKEDDPLIIHYPQFGKTFEIPYSPAYAEGTVQWMLDVADDKIGRASCRERV